jgi:hypothetical protein
MFPRVVAIVGLLLSFAAQSARTETAARALAEDSRLGRTARVARGLRRGAARKISAGTAGWPCRSSRQKVSCNPVKGDEEFRQYDVDWSEGTDTRGRSSLLEFTYTGCVCTWPQP